MRLLRQFQVVTRLWSILVVGFLGFAILMASILFTAFDLLLGERERGAANVVESAYSVVAHFGEQATQGELSDAEAKRQAANALRAMRYNEYEDGSKEYVWINDLDHRMVMHPINPALEGDNLADYTDPNGNYLFRDAVEVAKTQGSGFIEYQWPMPGRDRPVDKSSYVQLYEPWGWVIGSGVYVDRGKGELLGFAANFAWQVGIVLILLAAFVALITRSIVTPLNETVRSIRSMMGDTVDLTRRIAIDGDDEVAEVGRSINALNEASGSALREAATARESLQTSAQNLADSMERTNRGIERQSEETESLATAMNEMVSTVQEVARNTSNAADTAKEAEQETSNGRHIVEQTVEAIQNLSNELANTQGSVENLSNESQEIRSIVGSINEITEQTNLLSLNAAIEAARAGESGRGFSVVAEEVRKLSSRTQESTQQIQEIAERFQSSSQEALRRMEQSSDNAKKVVEESSRAGDSLNAITRAVGNISDLNTQIASAAEEQASTAEEINRNVVNIRDIAAETRSSVNQVTEAIDEQRKLVDRLNTELQRLRF